jgi:hypothetical protein
VVALCVDLAQDVEQEGVNVVVQRLVVQEELGEQALRAVQHSSTQAADSTAGTWSGGVG